MLLWRGLIKILHELFLASLNIKRHFLSYRFQITKEVLKTIIETKCHTIKTVTHYSNVPFLTAHKTKTVHKVEKKLVKVFQELLLSFFVIISNRSATLDQTGPYHACLQDVEMAFKYGYPKEMYFKVNRFECKCKTKFIFHNNACYSSFRL